MVVGTSYNTSTLVYLCYNTKNLTWFLTNCYTHKHKHTQSAWLDTEQLFCAEITVKGML